MPDCRHRLALAAAALTLAAAAAMPLDAQRAKEGGISIHADAPDSAARIVPRQWEEGAEAAIRTRDRRVALLLLDSSVVLQLTDRGLREVQDDSRDDRTSSVGGRILAAVVRAGVSSLLDHGIAYRLSALRGAYVRDGRLVLEDRAGRDVFGEVEVNERRPMEDFAPAQAQRFAAKLDRAIRAARRE